MRTLKEKIMRHRLLTASLVFLFLVSSVFVTVSMANQKAEETQTCDWYRHRNYYSDALHTTFIGTRLWYCDGYVGASGSTSQYYDETTCECDPTAK